MFILFLHHKPDYGNVPIGYEIPTFASAMATKHKKGCSGLRLPNSKSMDKSKAVNRPHVIRSNNGVFKYKGLDTGKKMVVAHPFNLAILGTAPKGLALKKGTQ